MTNAIPFPWLCSLFSSWYGMKKNSVIDEADPHSILTKNMCIFRIIFNIATSLVSENEPTQDILILWLYAYIYTVSMLLNFEVSSLQFTCPTWSYVALMLAVVLWWSFNACHTSRSSKVESVKTKQSLILHWVNDQINPPDWLSKSKINPFMTSNNLLLANLSTPSRTQTLHKHMDILD